MSLKQNVKANVTLFQISH